MPASETPTNPDQQQSQPAHTDAALARSSGVALQDPPTDAPASQDSDSRPAGYSTSRYVDYDTHELLEKISQYEDERRWQRIREGIWISLLMHIFLFSALTWIPRYVFHQPQVIDPFDALRKRKDLTYLDELPDALKQIQKARPKLPPIQPKDAQVDRKTLDALKALEKARPKPTPAPEPQAEVTPPPAPIAQPQPQPTPAPPSVATPTPQPQIPLDTPRPAPVPARPNFSLGANNPADQMRQAIHNSMGSGSNVQLPPSHLSQHPSAGAGGLEVLSDTQGVDFHNWLIRWHSETQNTWDPLIPEEVNPPISKRGTTVIRFKVLPNGHVMPGSMVLEGGTTADTAMSRAAWGAITGSNYPALPREFHGPYLELRAYFLYGEEMIH